MTENDRGEWAGENQGHDTFRQTGIGQGKTCNIVLDNNAMMIVNKVHMNNAIRRSIAKKRKIASKNDQTVALLHTVTELSEKWQGNCVDWFGAERKLSSILLRTNNWLTSVTSHPSICVNLSLLLQRLVNRDAIGAMSRIKHCRLLRSCMNCRENTADSRHFHRLLPPCSLRFKEIKEQRGRRTSVWSTCTRTSSRGEA